MDAALLAGAHAYGHAVLYVADGVALGVLKRDEGNDQIYHSLFGQFLVVGDDVLQEGLVDLEVVVALLEGDAEHVLGLLRSADVIFVDLDDVVLALLLGPEDLQGLVGVARGYDAVGDFVLKIGSGRCVADVGQSRPVAVAAEPVGAARPDVGAGYGGDILLLHEVDLPVDVGKGPCHCSARRGHVLEACRAGKAGGFLELLDELPGVERVHEVDVAGAAVEYGERELGAVLHVDGGRLLVRVASVLEFEFFHCFLLNLPGACCRALLRRPRWRRAKLCCRRSGPPRARPEWADRPPPARP